MMQQVTRFMDLFEKSGMNRPLFLMAFFHRINLDKPQSFSGILSCAEKAFEETEKPISEQILELEKTGTAIERRLERIK